MRRLTRSWPPRHYLLGCPSETTIALMQSCWDGDADAVQLRLRVLGYEAASTEMNQISDADGFGLLHAACSGLHVAVVRLLLERGGLLHCDAAGRRGARHKPGGAAGAGRCDVGRLHAPAAAGLVRSVFFWGVR